MKRQTLQRALTAAVLGSATALSITGAAHADADMAMQIQTAREGTIITPGSSVPGKPGFAHTNHHIFVPYGQPMTASSPSGKYETPASLACVYGLTAAVTGCNPETLTTVATGGSRVIAIVDAYDYPSAAADLGVYSAQFGLPAITSANFQVVYASGSKPPVDSTGGWELEEALDIEMVHALAPNAKIILVEAKSNSNADLKAAELAAAKAVAATGGEVSNSWGSSETSNEANQASQFTKTGVVFFASTGDSPGTEFPSVLTNVVAVGGTTINRDASGNFTSQSSWSSTGGGLSKYIARPSFQSTVTSVVGTKRGVPDISLVANPSSGAWVYDSNTYNGSVVGWTVVGGTSLASPASAAIVNAAGAFRTSSAAELAVIYASLGVAANFTDIVGGKCKNAPDTTAVVGYDTCTGIGTPFGLAGK